MNNRHLLQNLYERLQRDQIFLRIVLSATITTSLRDLVNSQFNTAMRLESEAANIAASRCWMIYDLQSDAKFFSYTIAKLNMIKARCDPDIASIIMLYNTKKTIQTLTDLRHTAAADLRVHSLCQRYIDCQTAAIQLLRIYCQSRTC